ncbi:putative transcription factor C2H2 family [Helianthus annuus]|nr:putative transcription factor C2H2 family [Helianthus annuus]KAJ0536112.1 putative transcription factor C2H2 family [Helianthus annuus]KAJ0543809.1 putative transcription factor C2H2 family [Helianthus annuus]KAJ0708862.1 putative transcription factor C2H2 family [Helianthus annuus]KAJ0712766.1 putative transcription factor C2H2 family [Helianthus annuus]
MVLPPPPLSLLCIISIVTLYLMIVYAVIGFIAKSDLFRVDAHEVDHKPSGLSREELQTLRCFNHKINEAHEESLSCSICLDDFKDLEVCKRFPSCEHVFHSHCIDLWLVHRRTCPICRTDFDHLIHVV